MTTLDIWVYDTSSGAASAAQTLRSSKLLRPGEIACVISWPRGEAAPCFDLLVRGGAARPESSGALGAWLTELYLGVFLGPLQGTPHAELMNLEFARPRLGLASVTVNRLRDDVTPGSSALLVVDAAHLDDIDDSLTTDRSARHWRAEADLQMSA